MRLPSRTYLAELISTSRVRDDQAGGVDKVEETDENESGREHLGNRRKEFRKKKVWGRMNGGRFRGLRTPVLDDRRQNSSWSEREPKDRKYGKGDSLLCQERERAKKREGQEKYVLSCVRPPLVFIARLTIIIGPRHRLPFSVYSSYNIHHLSKSPMFPLLPATRCLHLATPPRPPSQCASSGNTVPPGTIRRG